MIHGIFYGILITFIFYFTVLTFRQRNVSTMWFTLYIVCIVLLFSFYQGDLQKLLTQGLVNQRYTSLIALIGLIYFTGVKFLRSFLNINFYSKPIDRILLMFQWMGIVFIPMNLLPNLFTQIFSIILVLAGPIFSTGVLIFFCFRGVPNARFFTIGWIIGHMTLEISLLHIYHNISWVNGPLHLLPAAMIFSTVFFSIAIVEQSREHHEFPLQDNLTGIASRRLFDQALALEWNRNLRNQKPLSVIIADIDYFDAFNKIYGHTLGDECLKTIARVFNKYLRRASDMAARYGGEEFIAVLPDTILSEANFLAENIRHAVESLAIKHEQSRTGKIVTISLGTVTIIPSAKKTPADFIQKADEAVYLAKINGRNRVISRNLDNI